MFAGPNVGENNWGSRNADDRGHSRLSLCPSGAIT